MNYFDILLAKKLNGGGGGDITVESLSVTSNGTYSEAGKAYSPVTVSVQPPANSYQLKSITTPTSLATFDASAMPMPTLKASIKAQQDLHGYDHPWVGGAGKNKIIDSGYVQGVIGWDGTTADTIIENIHFITSPYIPINNNTAYTLSAIHGNIVRIYITDENHNTLYFSGNKPIEGNNVSVPAKSGAVYFRFSIGIDDEAVIPSDYGTKVYGQLEIGNQATSFAPYSNICPISGWDEANISNTDDVDNPTVTQTTTISLGQTVYGGELDVVNGTSGNKVTYGFKQGFTRGALDSSGKLYKLSPILDDVAMWTDTSKASEKIMSNMFEVLSLRDARTATTPSLSQHETSFYVGGYVGDEATLDALLSNLQVKYELATPTTLTTQPTPIKSLNEQNNLSVDCGEVIEGEYFKALGGD